jgi:hypothetical protein
MTWCCNWRYSAPAFSWRRSELDGFPAAEREGYIDMKRHYRAYQRSEDGDIVYELDISRPRLRGEGDIQLATYGPLRVTAGDRM